MSNNPEPPPPVCSKCGAKLRKPELKVFDPKKNRDVRLYRCECGALTWDDWAEPFLLTYVNVRREWLPCLTYR